MDAETDASSDRPAQRVEVAVLPEPFEPKAILARLPSGPDTGAVASFLGLCRGEGGRLEALELEHYPGMAEAEIARIAHAALARFDAQAILAVHRCGRVPVGGPIVLVAASAAHRSAAFDAVRFVMDYLKTDAPFWKREHLTDGTVGPWVDATSEDDSARAAWS